MAADMAKLSVYMQETVKERKSEKVKKNPAGRRFTHSLFHSFTVC
jgi:cytochrome b